MEYLMLENFEAEDATIEIVPFGPPNLCGGHPGCGCPEYGCGHGCAWVGVTDRNPCPTRG